MKKNQRILKSFFKKLKKKSRNKKVRIAYLIFGTVNMISNEVNASRYSCMRLEDGSEGIYYDIDGNVLFYTGKPYGFPDQEDISFDITGELLSLIGEKMLTIFKEVAASKGTAYYAFDSKINKVNSPK